MSLHAGAPASVPRLIDVRVSHSYVPFRARGFRLFRTFAYAYRSFAWR
jgi:hypothetical protein